MRTYYLFQAGNDPELQAFTDDPTRAQKGLWRGLADGGHGATLMKRAWSRSTLPRPYICCLTSFSFVI